MAPPNASKSGAPRQILVWILFLGCWQRRLLRLNNPVDLQICTVRVGSLQPKVLMSFSLSREPYYQIEDSDSFGQYQNCIHIFNHDERKFKCDITVSFCSQEEKAQWQDWVTFPKKKE